MRPVRPAGRRPLLDRWLLSELNSVTADVTAALEGFDTAAAGRRLAAFIDDLSNWYVRRSRRRFWDGPRTPTARRPSPRCYECVHTLTRLMAPFVPFVTDYVWGLCCAPPGRRIRCTWPAGRPLIRPDRRAAFHPDGAWPGGWSSWAGRPGRAASVQIRQPLGACAGRGAGFADLPPSCGTRSRPSSTCARWRAEHGRRATWSTTS